MVDHSQMNVAALWCYPVKGLRGMRVPCLDFEQRGPRFDRRWVLVRPDGSFISQRSQPRLALIGASIRHEALHLELAANDVSQYVAASKGKLTLRDLPCRLHLQLGLDEQSQRRHAVEIWGSQMAAPVVSSEADTWFSQLLGEPCHLLRLDNAVDRPLDSRHRQMGHQVSFADRAPVLVTTTASMAAVNAGLPQAVDQRRFRPNIVVSTSSSAFDEMHWQRLQVGAVLLAGGYPCLRCNVVGVDPDSGQAYRKGDINALGRVHDLKSWADPHSEQPTAKAVFGQGFAVVQTGAVREGDEVDLQARQALPDTKG